MTNLLNYVKDNLSDEVISRVGSLIGENTSNTKSAISAALPTVLKGIINRGDTTENAKSLREFMSLEGTNKTLFSDLLGADTKVAKDSYIAKGGRIVEYLFGKSKRNLLGNIEKGVGLNEAKSTTLTNALAPLALASVNKLATKENYTDAQLARYLNDQKAFLTGTTERVVNTTKERVVRKEPVVEKTRTVAHEEQSSGMGWLAWLLPLLLIGGLLWWFMGRDTTTTRTQTQDKTSVTKTTPTTTNQVATSDKAATTPATTTTQASSDNNTSSNQTGTTEDRATNEAASITSGALTVDANGNLVDGKGNIVAKAGSFTEKDGIFLDAEGKKIGILKKIGKAIGAAATKTADAFNDVFSGMFKNKEKVGSTYTLSDIAFDDTSHKISGFSKAEVEGLAGALKAYPDAKIQVQVHSNDGKNKIQNKEFTKLRAKVVHDMLVTLGVDDGQISFKGMGNGDEAKAAAEKVEIMVEQTVKSN